MDYDVGQQARSESKRGTISGELSALMRLVVRFRGAAGWEGVIVGRLSERISMPKWYLSVISKQVPIMFS
jgi:hypothetical protein